MSVVRGIGGCGIRGYLTGQKQPAIRLDRMAEWGDQSRAIRKQMKLKTTGLPQSGTPQPDTSDVNRTTGGSPRSFCNLQLVSHTLPVPIRKKKGGSQTSKRGGSHQHKVKPISLRRICQHAGISIPVLHILTALTARVGSR